VAVRSPHGSPGRRSGHGVLELCPLTIVAQAARDKINSDASGEVFSFCL